MGAYLEIISSEGTPDIAGNKSPVTTTIKIHSNYGTHDYNHYTLSVNNGGVYHTSNAISWGNSNYGSATWVTTTLKTYTDWIDHNSDGSKTITIGAGLPTNTSAGNLEKTITKKLTTIPRASSMSVGYTQYGSGANAGYFSFAISRASSGFTHIIKTTINGITYQINGIATSTTQIIPCSAIPKAISGTATFNLYTYNGSTHIGTKTYSGTATVPSYVKPTFDDITATPNLDLLKTKSNTLLKINGASGIYGSTISSYRIQSAGIVVNSSSYTYDCRSSGTVKFDAYVVDSRGRSSTTKSVTLTISDFKLPEITKLLVERCDVGGTPSILGEYAKVTPTFTDGLNCGTLTKELYYSSTYHALTLLSGESIVVGGSYDSASAYDFKFKITDAYSDVIEQIIKMPTSNVPIDIYGNSVAIGGAVTKENAFEVFNNMYLGDRKIIDSGSNANGNWIRYADGTQICWNNKYVGGIPFTVGALYYSENLSYSFPIAFVSTPSIDVSAHHNGMAGIGTVDCSTSVWSCYVTSFNATTRHTTVRMMAVGRWY